MSHCGTQTTISVIIPTRNRPADLVETTHAILRQTRQPDELIVVDQSATGESGRQLRELVSGESSKRLNYIWDPTITGLPMARNIGFTVSTGELVCYLDDDITPAPDYLAEIERGLEDFPDWDGLCGRFTESEYSDEAWRPGRALFRRGLFRDERARLATMDRPSEVRLICGGASCFRREVLNQFRFDENMMGYALGEDVEFCMRAGRKFRFGAYPAAQWHHRRSEVGRPEPTEMRRMARASAAYLWRIHRRHPGDDLSYAWLLIGFGLERLLSIAGTRRRSLAAEQKPGSVTSQSGCLGANSRL